MNKMIVIGGAAALLLVAGGGGAAFMLMGKEDPAAGMAEPEVAAAKEVFYYNIQPEFVVNFKGKSRDKFMMVEFSVATHDQEVTALMDDHSPELRNNLLNILAEQEAETLKTSGGKQALRDSALAAIDELVTKYYRPEKIEAVYLTRLVMQ